jgi:hypothetical protein
MFKRLSASLRSLTRRLSRSWPQDGRHNRTLNSVLERDWLNLSPRVSPDRSPAQDRLEELKEAADLLVAANQYRDLVSRPGWARFLSDVHDEAQARADALVGSIIAPGESPELYAMRMTAYQQFIGACSIVNIPQATISLHEERTTDNA